jgi:vacuolar protein sorting-associated protein 54
MQTLLRQSRLFLDELHAKTKNQLVNALDHERWIQCDVSIERQREIEKLATGKAFLPMDKHGGPTNPAYIGGSMSSSVTNNTPSSASSTTTKETRPVVIDSHEYRVVWSVLLLIEIVLTYLDVAFHFPLITNEVIHKLVDQVSLCNSRTKKLVLGAQAIQSAARLKSISAKHLALTGQSLSLLIALLPHIRAALLAQLPAKHHVLLTELDRLSQELFDHHNEIVGKFVMIVNDVIEHSASVKLKQVDWDRFQGNLGANLKETPLSGSGSGSGSGGVGVAGASTTATAPGGAVLYSNCEYFEDMQKNIITLHKVLAGILPGTQITDIFSRIFGMLSRKIPSHFEEIMPLTSTGKQRILDEITYLVMTLSRLKYVDGTILTSQLEEYFRRRYAVGSLATAATAAATAVSSVSR